MHRFAIEVGRKHTDVIGAFRIFDFNNIGPHIGHEHGAKRAGQQAGEVENTKANEWAGLLVCAAPRWDFWFQVSGLWFLIVCKVSVGAFQSCVTDKHTLAQTNET